MMEAPIPLSAMDCYEDMFKEITKKLYGEEGLPDIQDGEGVMRMMDFDDGAGGFKEEGGLTAFGLALMQNGYQSMPPDSKARTADGKVHSHFHSLSSHSNHSSHPHSSSSGDDKWVSSDEVLPWTSSKIASYNPAQKLFKCFECDCVGFLSRVAEHWLGTHANLRVFQCPRCPYTSAWARCVRMHLTRQHNEQYADGSLWKENPILEEVTKFLQNLKTKVESKQEYQAANADKRYCCTFCPYATDRRDLFTRHENIHKDEKPFQCYVCQKQFNRADHVKKHFLRMHRDHPYDINKIRRQPPKNASGMSYYNRYNNRPQQQHMQHQSHGQQHHSQHPPPPILHQPTFNINRTNLKHRDKYNHNNLHNNISHNGPHATNNKPHGSKKKKGDKLYSCCYCSWSGVDNWCLKRHLNTHIKPFLCNLCDYKAARSERLATHVLKVHNKRVCNKCSFLADDQLTLSDHMQEHHPLEYRNNRSNNVLRNVSFSCYQPSIGGSFCQNPLVKSRPSCNICGEHFETHADLEAHSIMQHKKMVVHCDICDFRTTDELSMGEHLEVKHNIKNPKLYEEEEPPYFLCHDCGCEFIDDNSLETHILTHHKALRIEPKYPYICSVCCYGCASQNAMMEHMRIHAGLLVQCRAEECSFKTPYETALQEHVEMLHNDEFIIRCPHCGLSVSTHDAFNQHWAQHHNELCMACSGVFKKHFGIKDAVVKSFKKSNGILASVIDNLSERSNPLPSDTLNDSKSFLEWHSRSLKQRSRKQSCPRRLVTTLDPMEIQVLCETRKSHKMKKKSVAYKLKEKYTQSIVSRKEFRCCWCQSVYFIKSNLLLHVSWRHTKSQFQCEHCDVTCKHQYQVVLHASREHVNPHKTSDIPLENASTATASTEEPFSKGTASATVQDSQCSSLVTSAEHVKPTCVPVLLSPQAAS